METTECLFVGGPWDGRRLSIDSRASTVSAPLVEDSSTRPIDNSPSREEAFAIVQYRREKLFAPGRQWSLFVAPEIEPGEVIARLIEGYAPRK